MAFIFRSVLRVTGVGELYDVFKRIFNFLHFKLILWIGSASFSVLSHAAQVPCAFPTSSYGSDLNDSPFSLCKLVT